MGGLEALPHRLGIPRLDVYAVPAVERGGVRCPRVPRQRSPQDGADQHTSTRVATTSGGAACRRAVVSDEAAFIGEHNTTGEEEQATGGEQQATGGIGIVGCIVG